MNLSLHIGYPKTGTTTLQRHLFAKHSQITYLGKPYRSEFLKEEMLALIMRESVRYNPQKLKKFVDDLRQKENNNSSIVLSDEICVSATKARDKGLVARRLKEVFAPCKIVITIRNQLDILKSAYISGGRLFKDTPPQLMGCAMSFEDWLEMSYRNLNRSYIGNVDYFPVVGYYRELFGPENTIVLLFEQFRASPSEFIQELSRFLNIDFEESTRLIHDQHENPRMPQSVLDHERLRTLFYPASRISPVSKMLGVYCRLKSSLRGRGPADADYTAEWKDRLFQFYRNGNRELVRELNLPLEKYNFPL
jgi:hypothetical protein